MPQPIKGEKKQTFLDRCMTDLESIDTHPNEKQRYAVCIHTWETHSREALSNYKKNVRKEMRYYVLDYGKDMIHEGKILTDYLERQGFHHIVYLTNADGLLCMEEVDEDEFLNHFKNTKQNA